MENTSRVFRNLILHTDLIINKDIILISGHIAMLFSNGVSTGWNIRQYILTISKVSPRNGLCLEIIRSGNGECQILQTFQRFINCVVILPQKVFVNFQIIGQSLIVIDQFIRIGDRRRRQSEMCSTLRIFQSVTIHIRRIRFLMDFVCGIQI